MIGITRQCRAVGRTFSATKIIRAIVIRRTVVVVKRFALWLGIDKQEFFMAPEDVKIHPTKRNYIFLVGKYFPHVSHGDVHGIRNLRNIVGV
jgi:hypothetical protein